MITQLSDVNSGLEPVTSVTQGKQGETGGGTGGGDDGRGIRGVGSSCGVCDGVRGVVVVGKRVEIERTKGQRVRGMAREWQRIFELEWGVGWINSVST